MATNYDNISGIQDFISSPAIEGYRSAPYVPMGCYGDEAKKVRLSHNDLKKDFNKLIKEEKDDNTRNKLKAMRSTESLCLAMNKKFLPIGKSGVTFSFGIDLGQVDETTLRGTYGISENAINAVRPYLKTTSATELNNVLGKQPVTISAGVLKEFETKYLTYFIGKTADRFDKIPVSDPKVKPLSFAELSKNNQSVLVSILWHHGVNTKIKWIKEVFDLAKKNQWLQVKDLLLKQEEYANRRKAEANAIDIPAPVTVNAMYA